MRISAAIRGAPRTSLHLVIVGLLLCGSSVAQQPHTLTGDIRVHKSFHSKILNNDRDVVVYLPPEYETDKSKRYSALYLNDGQNLFDGATSFIPGQEWRADEVAQELIAAGKIEPLIIVGEAGTLGRCILAAEESGGYKKEEKWRAVDRCF